MLAVAVAFVLALVGCTESGDAKPAAGAKRTIVFATQGLGAERPATEAAVREFERTHPGTTVKVHFLPANTDAAYRQLIRLFTAAERTPDVVTLDVIWPAAFADAGWIADLTRFRPVTSNFFQGQVQAGMYRGRPYAIPWFINAEGLYYRTDLVPTPPRTPAELVSTAQAAMRKDPSLKFGLAFEGDRYEGSVTALVNFLGGFGGQLDPGRLNTPQNRQALRFMRDVVHKIGLAPRSVSGWQEPHVQTAFLAGQTPFAMNWPYLFQLAEQNGSRVKGRTGWIPFPSNGTPTAALGGAMLAVNARSARTAEAWQFIQFLTSESAQLERAILAGDPPAVPSVYDERLYAKAPYFRQQKVVFQYATPRPASAAYPKISTELQEMVSAVLAGTRDPDQALATADARLASVGGAAR